MIKVSVVVPVYNPGTHIDDCIRTLLDQSLPPDEYETIFVDDGSTDGTESRLDELAGAHPNVRVEHMPNSGWPGRPRNVGMDLARGKYVLFVDNDDWVEREALERMYAVAERDEADMVIGKVVGHGKPVPPTLFAENRTGVGIEWPPLVWLLTPHRLFRLAHLREHELRFPEGPRRLEDHVFVLGALFRTDRVSVLADRPCYHWVLRDRADNASAHEFEPAMYYGNLREVLDVIDANTEPGPLRDRLHLRYYRGKVLSRVGGTLFLNRAPEARRARFDEITRLIEERFPPALDARLPFALRARAALVRAGSFAGITRLAELESRLDGALVAKHFEVAGDAITLRLESTVRDAAGLLRFERNGAGTMWRPPAAIAAALPDGVLEAPEAVESSDATILVRGVDPPDEQLVPATVRPRLAPGRRGDRIVLDIDATIPIAPTARGERVVGGTIDLAGFRLPAPVTPGARQPRLVLAFDGHGGVRVVPPGLRQRVAAAAPWLRRLIGRLRTTR